MTTHVGTHRARGISLVTLSTLVIGLAVSGCTPALPAQDDQEQRAEYAEVVAVVDGDTIDVQLPDGKERIRIIGIDTPEIGREAGEVNDCYAEEARTFLDELLYGRTVELRTDPSQQSIDDYGRLLRHVYIDGEDAALAVLSAGAGIEYTYDADYVGQANYRAAEATAREEALGLWSLCPHPNV